MAANLSATTVPGSTSVTLAIINDCEGIECPREATAVYIQFKAAGGQVAYTGVEGAALGDAGCEVAAGAALPWPLFRPADRSLNPVIYLEPYANDQVVDLHFVKQVGN